MVSNGCDLVVMAAGRVEYGRGLAKQEELVARKLDGDPRDYLLILEHDPVYTLGRGADEADLLGAPDRLHVPVFRVGRGGGVTFHGPGQLVAYPILRLAHGGRDVHRYVRLLEQVIVETCRTFAVEATARPDLTGVWVGEEKIASIGIGVRHWITYHGLAINVSTDLVYFNNVVTCRMPEIRVTSLQRVLGRPVSLDEVARHFADCFAATMGYASVQWQQVA
jgi:lipoyl(octanoyl) transferase